MNDKRSRKIILVAHCLLNQNVKVGGAASHPGVFTPLASLLLGSDVGILQLPCPEMIHLGPNRPSSSDTIEHYDTSEYRKLCRSIATRCVSEALAYVSAGYEALAVLGVDGSPSCAVARVPRVMGDGGRQYRRGMGIFMEQVEEELRRSGLRIELIGIPENKQSGNLSEAISAVAVRLDPEMRLGAHQEKEKGPQRHGGAEGSTEGFF